MTEATTPIRLSAEIRVQCPREKAFAYVADIRSHPRWSVDDMEVLQADPDPVGVGWRCRTTGHSVVRGGAQEAEIEVTAFEPPDQFAFRAVSHGTHVFDNVFYFREQDGETVIERVLIHDAPPDTIERMKVVGPDVGRRRNEGLQLLKEQLEAAP